MDMQITTIGIIASAFFAIAVIHTFASTAFKELGHRSRRHAGLFHLLGEVEVVFGFWAMIFIMLLMAIDGFDAAYKYTEGIDYAEPVFVFGIMVVAASKPVLFLIKGIVFSLGKILKRFFSCDISTAILFVCLSVLPLLGSLITEPAAMTIAALLLRDHFFSESVSERTKYAIIGVLFLNISVGGTMTHYAAPPVLMVASTWNWTSSIIFSLIGYKSLLIVLVNSLWVTLLVRKEFKGGSEKDFKIDTKMSKSVVVTHLIFIVLMVFFLHHSVIVIGLVLLFLGFCQAYSRWQSKLILREALLVAFFLAGLKTLGDLQVWWINPVLTRIPESLLYYISMGLTAVIDNAAITYLGALVPNPSEFFKVALVTGAVTGGGLTIIANAPNPAGVSLLQTKFKNKTVNAGALFMGALPPTIVAIVFYQFF